MSPLPAPPVDPTVDDLQAWARRALEEACDGREEGEAFVAGWLACLVHLQAFGSFKPRIEAEE